MLVAMWFWTVLGAAVAVTMWARLLRAHARVVRERRQREALRREGLALRIARLEREDRASTARIAEMLATPPEEWEAFEARHVDGVERPWGPPKPGDVVVRPDCSSHVAMILGDGRVMTHGPKGDLLVFPPGYRSDLVPHPAGGLVARDALDATVERWERES